MGLGKKVGEYSMKATSVTLSQEPGGGLKTTVNYEGPATGFGTVLGTLTFLSAGPGAQSGTCTWLGAGFLPKGETVGGSGGGVWEKAAGKHKWRVRLLTLISDGTVTASDGEVDLASRSFSGKLLEWS